MYLAKVYLNFSLQLYISSQMHRLIIHLCNNIDGLWAVLLTSFSNPEFTSLRGCSPDDLHYSGSHVSTGSMMYTQWGHCITLKILPPYHFYWHLSKLSSSMDRRPNRLCLQHVIYTQKPQLYYTLKFNSKKCVMTWKRQDYFLLSGLFYWSSPPGVYRPYERNGLTAFLCESQGQSPCIKVWYTYWIYGSTACS